MNSTDCLKLRLVVTLPQCKVRSCMMRLCLVCCHIPGELHWAWCTEGAQQTFMLNGICQGSWSPRVAMPIAMVPFRWVLNSRI